MSYVNTQAMLRAAREDEYAIGAFNVVDYVTTMAAVKAAENRKSPVIIQASTKTVAMYGSQAIAGWVKALADTASVPVALHLDHCKDIDMITDCIKAGWSSVMIDGSLLSLDANIRLTQQVVELAGPKGVTVEGEVGAIVGVEDDIFIDENDAVLADPESCVEYVNATGVDILAPAIGTAHGKYRRQPKIDYELLDTIRKRTGVPLAIHGGTGLSTEAFQQCIAAGGTKINISTNLKYLFREALEGYYRENPDDYEPIRAIGYVRDRVCQGIESLIEIFGSVGRA